MTVPIARGQIASVIPDHDGTLWFLVLGEVVRSSTVQRPAMIGAVDGVNGVQVVRELDQEVLENGLAIGPDGVSVLSDRALRGVRFEAGAIVETFSFPYARATVKKPGAISWGSGSTPTLVGDHLVAFTDKTQTIRFTCSWWTAAPNRRQTCASSAMSRCFAAGASANGDSVISSNGAIIVQNWSGAPTALLGGSQRGLVPGLVRYDVRDDETGCDLVWSSDALTTTATLKLSTATVLLYGGMLDRENRDVDAYYLGAVELATGREVFGVLLGVGDASNIGLSPTYVGPDGAIYQPVRSGVYRVADGMSSGGCGASGNGGGGGLVILALLAMRRRPRETRPPARVLHVRARNARAHDNR